MLLVEIQYVFRDKGKGKFHPRTGHEDPEGAQRYSSTHFLTSVLDGVGGQCHAPATSLPGRRSGTHGTGGWVGPRAGLDRYIKSCLHRGFIPGLSSLYQGFSNVTEFWDESVTWLHTDGSL